VTTIRYSLPARSNVELAVFNVSGQLVRVLERGLKPLGTYDATWDGRDAAGATVASGVYFYRLKAGTFTETRKMLFMK
jgi:flagellar hook assembly protein FlgD